MRVGLMPNINKKICVRKAVELASWLRERGLQARFLEEDGPTLKVKEGLCSREEFTTAWTSSSPWAGTGRCCGRPSWPS